MVHFVSQWAWFGRGQRVNLVIRAVMCQVEIQAVDPNWSNERRGNNGRAAPNERDRAEKIARCLLKLEGG